MVSDGSLERAWTCPSGLAATLTHYPGAGSQPRHAHDHLQISFVLAGLMRERLEGRDYEACTVSRGCKPAGAAPSDAWGGDGVLVFSLRLRAGLAAGLGLDGEAPGWSPAAEPRRISALVRL